MKRPFRPRLVPAICVAIATPILISLGLWQLDRAAQRQDAMKRYESRIAAPALPIGAQMETPHDMEYRQITASGAWDQTKEFLLDNQVLNTRAGYHVITPLVLGDHKTAVLVNRGWIQAPADRTHIPQIPRLDESGSISGIAVLPPSEHFLLKDPEPLGAIWQPLWQALDIERFREAVGYRLHDFVVVLDRGHPSGFEYDFTMRQDAWIVRHKAYALQWFALAATLLVIYFVAISRRRKGNVRRV